MVLRRVVTAESYPYEVWIDDEPDSSLREVQKTLNEGYSRPIGNVLKGKYTGWDKRSTRKQRQLQQQRQQQFDPNNPYGGQYYR